MGSLFATANRPRRSLFDYENTFGHENTLRNSYRLHNDTLAYKHSWRQCRIGMPKTDLFIPLEAPGPGRGRYLPA